MQSKKLLFVLLLSSLFSFVLASEAHAKNTDTIIDQEHFRFYDNDGTTVNNATGYGVGNAAVDTSITSVPAGEQFHIRLGALQTANKPDLTLTRTVKLQYSTNVTASDCSTGTWTDVPTQSGYTSQAFAQFTTGNFADGDATTRLLDAVHTQIGGDGVETDGSPNSVSYTNGSNASTEHAEWEWAIEEKAGTASQQYWFRFINSSGTTTNVTWSVCPSLTTSAGLQLTQNDFEFWVDDDTLDFTSSPDIWGNPDIAENTAIRAVPVSNNPLTVNDEIRIRFTIEASGGTLNAASEAFILQYDEASDCTTASGWTNVGSSPWVFASSSVADNTTLTTTKVAVSDVVERYHKSNTSSTNPNSATNGQDIELDWHIQYTGSQSAATYCFRMRRDDPADLDAYNSDSYPKLDIRPGTANQMRHGNFFIESAELGFFWAD